MTNSRARQIFFFSNKGYHNIHNAHGVVTKAWIGYEGKPKIKLKVYYERCWKETPTKLHDNLRVQIHTKWC
jgi:hypothetical protein